LIIGSCFLITKDSPWPGYLALFPTVGVFLILQAQQNNSFVTGNIVAQKIGAWSYSIYLWHWPLVAAIYYFSLNDVFIYLGIVSSVLLGFLSNKYVEGIKFRNEFSRWFDYLKCKPLYFAMIIGLGGVYVFKTMPNKYLFPMPQSVTASIERKAYECFDKEYQHQERLVACDLRRGSFKILALGDSHMYSFLPALERFSEERDLSLQYVGFSGCPPLLDIFPLRADQGVKNCNELNKKSVDFAIDNKIDLVFLVARWSYYTQGAYNGDSIQYLSASSSGKKSRSESVEAFRHGLSATFKALEAAGINVVLMLQVPMQRENSDKIYYNSLVSGQVSEANLFDASISVSQHEEFQHETNAIISAVATEYKNVIVVNPLKYLCVNGRCPVGNKSQSYYFDDDHLSITGSYQLLPLLEKIINVD